MTLAHIDTTVAGYLRSAADLLDAQPDRDVSDIVRDVTGDSPRWYTHTYNAFVQAGNGLDPLSYWSRFGPALTAHRMREVAGGLSASGR